MTESYSFWPAVVVVSMTPLSEISESVWSFVAVAASLNAVAIATICALRFLFASSNGTSRPSRTSMLIDKPCTAAEAAVAASETVLIESAIADRSLVLAAASIEAPSSVIRSCALET